MKKAKSETIIYPVLQEVRRILKPEVSLFSRKNFTVKAALCLNGYVDYLISRSREQLEIEAPVVVIAEAKIDNFNEVIGQCIAEIVAAQKINQANRINTIYECGSSGTLCFFLLQ